MNTFDILSIVLIGAGTGFGSSVGVELAKALVQYFKTLKIVKRNIKKGGTIQ